MIRRLVSAENLLWLVGAMAMAVVFVVIVLGLGEPS